MDLIILALIAGFIIYRLYTTLGEKTGYKGDKKNPSSNVVDFHSKQPGNTPAPQAQPVQVEEIPLALRSGVQAITKVDPDFSLGGFQEGATVAFEMILDAYATGDSSTLKGLLSSDIYKAFKGAIDERKSKGQTLENTLVRVEKCQIEDVRVEAGKAQVRVHYVTEQTPVLRDKSGEVIDGNPNQIDQIVDTWTFEKSLRSSDPNWLLVSTEFKICY